MRSNPLLPPAIGLSTGIAAARWVGVVPLWIWLLLVAVAAAIIGLGFLASRGRGWPIWAAVVLVMAGVGGLLEQHLDPVLSPRYYGRLPDSYSHVCVRLVEEPVLVGRTHRAKAAVEWVDGIEACGELRLYVRADSLEGTLHYGDRLLMHVYPDFGRNRIYLPTGHYRVVGWDSTSVRARAERVRQLLLRRMRQGGIGTRTLGVAEALTTGWRADLDSEVWQQWRRAGIVHLLCLSGLHVGLLAGMVRVLLWGLGNRRRGRMARGAVQMVAVWGLALLSGCAPATCRAAMMFSLFIVADMMGRRTSRLNLLALSAIVTLISSPTLLFDVGWQLSYVAVGGILLAMPLVRLFRWRVWQWAMVSTAAQLATLPIVVGVFGTVPTGFLLANMVVVPAAGLLLGVCMAYVALPCGMTAWAVEGLIGLVDRFTAWVSARPWAMVEGVDLSTGQLVVLAVVVLGMFLSINPLMKRGGR